MYIIHKKHKVHVHIPCFFSRLIIKLIEIAKCAWSARSKKPRTDFAGRVEGLKMDKNPHLIQHDWTSGY